jgi:hypothetical protein
VVVDWLDSCGAGGAQLSIEAERLCQSAARLDAVRREIGHRERRRAAEQEADAEYERRVAELAEAPPGAYPAGWITNGLPQFDNRIGDLAARGAYLADGHAGSNPSGGTLQI